MTILVMSSFQKIKRICVCFTIILIVLQLYFVKVLCHLRNVKEINIFLPFYPDIVQFDCISSCLNPGISIPYRHDHPVDVDIGTSVPYGKQTSCLLARHKVYYNVAFEKIIQTFLVCKLFILTAQSFCLRFDVNDVIFVQVVWVKLLPGRKDDTKTFNSAWYKENFSPHKFV